MCCVRQPSEGGGYSTFIHRSCSPQSWVWGRPATVGVNLNVASYVDKGVETVEFSKTNKVQLKPHGR